MESEAQKQIDVERQMNGAYSTDFMMIAQIAPYLKQRQEAATRYYKHGGHLSDNEKKQLIELVVYYNDCIKKVMGL